MVQRVVYTTNFVTFISYLGYLMKVRWDRHVTRMGEIRATQCWWGNFLEATTEKTDGKITSKLLFQDHSIYGTDRIRLNNNKRNTNSVACSPQTNYIDRATAACRLSANFCR
jgi:hypothetical protein